MNSASRILAFIAIAIDFVAIGPALAFQDGPATETLQACSAPSEMTRLDQAIVRTTARVARGRPLRIVAFGSSSTAGRGASSLSQSYPSRLEAVLRSLLPGQDVTVINSGVSGEDAEAMLARLQRSVLAA